MSLFDTKQQRAAWMVAILGVLIVIALARVVDTRLRELHRARSRARHPSR